MPFAPQGGAQVLAGADMKVSCLPFQNLNFFKAINFPGEASLCYYLSCWFILSPNPDRAPLGKSCWLMYRFPLL